MTAGANTAVPHQPVARVLRLAQAVLYDYLERGWFELSMCGGRDNYGHDAVVPFEDRPAILADPASWDPYARGEDDPYYEVNATDAGLEAYYQSGEPEQPMPPVP